MKRGMRCGGLRDPGGIEPLVSAVVDEHLIGVDPVRGKNNDEWLNLVLMDVSLEVKMGNSSCGD